MERIRRLPEIREIMKKNQIHFIDSDPEYQTNSDDDSNDTLDLESKKSNKRSTAGDINQT